MTTASGVVARPGLDVRFLDQREQVARAFRVGHCLGLVDLFSHLSVRLPGNAGVAVSPRFEGGLRSPAELRAADVALLDPDGRSLEGGHDAGGDPAPEAPAQVQIDLALYRRRPHLGAVLVGAPEAAVMFGIAGRQVLPLTHSDARMIHDGVAVAEPDRLVVDETLADALAREIGGASLCQLPGLGLVVAGDSPDEVLKRTQAFEHIARMSLDVLALTDEPRIVTSSEAEAITAELRAHAHSEGHLAYHDLGGYHASLDPGPRPRSEPARAAGASGTEAARAAVALACRTLAREDSLVALFEHVSARLPGADRFAMNPARDFRTMRPEEIAVVAIDDDATWLDGPLPPAPFAAFHRDVFRARPEVNAIVHTHNRYLRTILAGGHQVRPVFRNGAALAVEPLPVLDRPDLLFSDSSRQEAIRLLADRPLLHVRSHGTDHLAADLMTATVDAIHLEQLSRLLVGALRIGTPKALSPALLADLQRHAPSAARWWAYYASAT